MLKALVGFIIYKMNIIKIIFFNCEKLEKSTFRIGSWDTKSYLRYQTRNKLEIGNLYIRVQILDKVVCILIYTHALGKGMNPP